MPSQYIETNHIQLHVVTDGPADGTPVILLHGFPEFHYGWRKQVPALAEAGFHVITPDQRGYNLSDKPKGVSAYKVETLAKDVLGLFDHYGIQKARLVAHDWGGVVAWHLAIHYPERLEKLAILNAPHPDVMMRFMFESAEQRKKSWYVFFFQIPFFVEWILRKENYRNLVRTLVGSGRKSTFSRENIEEYRKAWSQPGALSAMLNWYRSIVRGSLKNVLRKKQPSERRVRVQTLLLWGKNDAALSHEMAQPSIEMCDDGNLIFFEKATHWVQHDEADEVNKNLIQFLR
jgi:pimeloyl-ACP methyl ester carboxylesterase